MADQQQGLARGDVEPVEHPRRRQSLRIMIEEAVTKLPKDIKNKKDRSNIIQLFLAVENRTDSEEKDFVSNLRFDARSYKVNEEGIIIDLTLGVYPLLSASWKLPILIYKFDLLAELHLFRCGRLPDEMELPNLKKLIIQRCDDQLLENLNPTTTTLPSLESLAISRCNLSPSNIKSWTYFMSLLPELKCLHFDATSNGCINSILKILKDHSLPLDKLQVLTIYDMIMSGVDLKMLLLDVLPRFKNLHVLNLQNNGIESFKPTSEAIQEKSRIISPLMALFIKSISKIVLDNNPVLEKIKNGNEEEKSALLICLSLFKRVSEITEKSSIHTRQFGDEIQNFLSLNRDGRILLEGGGDKLSPSVWPSVFVRPFRKIANCWYLRQFLPVETANLPLRIDTSVANNLVRRLGNSVCGHLLQSCQSSVFNLLRNGPIIQFLAGQQRDVNDNNSNNNESLSSMLSSSSPLSGFRRSRRLLQQEPIIETTFNQQQDDNDDDNDNNSTNNQSSSSSTSSSSS